MANSPSSKARLITSAPVRLESAHNKAAFHSSNEALDDYLKLRATQDERRGVAYPYVLVDDQSNVAAYSTLSATSILDTELPAKLQRALPHHAAYGATLIGRLAVDQSWQGQGLGSIMVAHALMMAFSQSPVASIAVVVDAIDDKAVSFYHSHSFVPMPDNPRTLFIVRDSLMKHLRS